MEFISRADYDGLKRLWSRRRYQRLNRGIHNRRKLKIARLGAGGGGGGGVTLSPISKQRIVNLRRRIVVSPIRILVRFHDAYVDMMIRVAAKLGQLNQKGLLRKRKVAKDKEILVSSNGEEVDSRLVEEIYKKLAASRQLDFSSSI